MPPEVISWFIDHIQLIDNPCHNLAKGNRLQSGCKCLYGEVRCMGCGHRWYRTGGMRATTLGASTHASHISRKWAHVSVDKNTYWHNNVQISRSPSPTLLEPYRWSSEFVHFLGLCVRKDAKARPTSEDLLKHPFLRKAADRSEIVKMIKRKAELQREVEEEALREEGFKPTIHSQRLNRPLKLYHL